MGWTSSIARSIIVFTFILFLVLYIIFPGKIYGFEWLAAAVIIILLIMMGIKILLKNNFNIKDSRFTQKLLWSALIIRVIVMFVLLAISYNTWNMFYTVGARDEMVYYRVASESMKIWDENSMTEAYSHILSSYQNDFADTGFATFLMIIVYIFGQSPVLIKLFLCLLGSLVAVRGYKLAGLLVEKPIARLAGIFLVLYPISWFYSSIILKESLMVLMMIEALINIVKIHTSFKIVSLIKAILYITLLFFFRPAISILLLMVLGFSFFIHMKRKNWLINVILAGVVIIIYLLFLKTTGKYDEYYNQYTNLDEFTEERLSYMESINPFVALLGSPVFAALSYIAPFPSVVLVSNSQGLSHTEYYYHVAGNIFWISLAFFSFYGLYYAIRYKSQEMAILIAFVVGYQFVLLKAMMFTSVRFSYPSKPFLLILAAYGIYKLKRRKWYPIYLLVALVMIVVWNYVRLKGRG